MKHFILYMFLLLSCFCSTQLIAQTPLQCDGKFFVSHAKTSAASDSIYVDRITFSGGNVTNIPFANNDTLNINALGFNPADGFIYGLQYHQYTPYPTRLVKIDATGTFYIVGSTTGDFPLAGPTGGNAFAGCFDKDGTYYISEDPADGTSGKLYSIDVTTNTSTLIGPTNIVPTNGADIFLADMAVNPVNDKLYGMTNYCCGEASVNTSAIYEIDKTTGAATWIRQLSPIDSYFGIVFNDDGELFAYKSNGTLYRINLGTGDITEVADGQSFTFADAANCSFRVSTYLSATAACVGSAANVTFTARINNYSTSTQNAVAYELELPAGFSFTQTTAAIETAMNPLYGGAVSANISSVNTGTNNKLVVSNLSIAVNNILSPSSTFTLTASIPNPTVDYNVMAQLTNLPAELGSTDPSDDPSTELEEDSTELLVAAICSVLPVQLVDFEVANHKTYASVAWTTESENNSAYFVVERSIDGVNWFGIGNVAATNSTKRTKYNFSDNKPVNGINYYRLRQVNLDNKYGYSTIKFATFDFNTKSVTVFPNPAHESFEIKTSDNRNSLYEILDISGRVVKKGEFRNTLKVFGLNAGVYVAKINTANVTETIKVVVQ